MAVKEVGVFEAKTHLSEILEEVERGTRYVITKRHRPIAEIRPIETAKLPLERGCAANPNFRMSEDFDEPLDDLRDHM